MQDREAASPAPLAAGPAAHAQAVPSLVAQLQTDPSRGLTVEQVVAARARYGANELAETAPTPMWHKFLGQFRELVIWILIVAALLSGATGEWADALAILAIVVINALLGFFQEERAERSLAALRRLATPQARVIRDGQPQLVAARELVPGDRIELEAGDHIPADARLLTAFAFRVQEAALTGESVPEEKEAGCVLPPATALGERRNMVYLGTVAVAGKASALVVATGMETELGRIAGMLQREPPTATPLQRRLTELGRVLAVLCLLIAGIVFAVEVARGMPWTEVLLLAVSLAVAAVPEGLPAVVTIALTVGLQRMVRRNALIRKLPSVETLGCVTVICSDKTGTLTRNEMTVREIHAGGHCYQVTGAGYAPQGQFLRCADGPDPAKPGPPIDPRGDADLLLVLTVGARCNHARVVPRGDESESWQVIGDPTEGALVVAALKAEVDGANQEIHAIYEIPFDSERKAMSVVVAGDNGGPILYMKGAPEAVLARCTHERIAGTVRPLTELRRQEIMQGNAAMAGRALRVLGLAYRELPAAAQPIAEAELTFVGLAGMMDPPREEVRAAVERCHLAGIRPVMITGDHPATALAIARELGIARPGDSAVTGTQLDSLSDEQLAAQVEHIAVFARVSAEHKLRVVHAWQSRGQVVAMTGDGVNDAPAVKAADIGIAMGITGTDVTKEASDMVLTDDNFASIVNAVEEGRGIFDNIQKFLHYLLAGNLGLILFIFGAALAGWPFPLVAIQILWINLVTNGLPALALGMEPPERDIMRRPPRPPREPVIPLRRGLQMLRDAILVAAVSAFGFSLVYQGEESQLPRARTVAFCLLACSFTFYSFSCRSLRHTMPSLGFTTNPYLLGAVAVSALLQLSVVTLPFAQPIFETATHFTPGEWLILSLLSLLPVTVIEVMKIAVAWLRGGEPDGAGTSPA